LHIRGGIRKQEVNDINGLFDIIDDRGLASMSGLLSLLWEIRGKKGFERSFKLYVQEVI
jgi:hypothetical protein